jgi:predicted component of type VI protein secretion system
MRQLEGWADRAWGLGAPLVTNASPNVLGYDDLRALARTSRSVYVSDDPRAVALRSVAATDASRWVTLAMNGLVGRPRLTKAGGGMFDEAHDLYVGAAYAVALCAARSFGRCGWACALSGPRGGVIDDLPVAMTDDRGSDVALSTEALVREDVALEAAKAGVALITSAANRDMALLSHAPTLYRGPSLPGGASAAAPGTLADQLFVARLANAVVQLASAIPRDTPPAAAREVATGALAELFAGNAGPPELDVSVTEEGAPALEVTVRTRGFLGVGLAEATLRAPLA